MSKFSLYSIPGHMVDASDFICGTYIHIHPSYMHSKCMAYMCSVVDIFVSSMYIAITCKVDAVGGCVSAHI